MSALDDIIARDAATPAAGTSALDALIARDAGPAAAPAVVAAPKTPYDELTRQLGLTARAGVNAVTGLPAMVGNALNGGINLGIHGVNSLVGTHIAPLQMPSDVIDRGMDKFGFPQPADDTEKMVQATASGMGTAGPGVALGKALSKYSAPVVKAVGKGLEMLPGMQMTGGAGAGAGGETARQNGAGPVGQILASLAGGTVGAVTPSVLLAGGRGAVNAARNVSGAVQPVVNPQKFVGTQLTQALGDAAPDLAAQLRAIPEYVPGSKPTTAQAAPNPVLVATEKAAANGNPNFKIALAAREAENNAARLNAINSVGKSPAELAAAQQARSAAAQPLYEAAHAQTAPVDAGFTQLAQRPAVAQAMQAAEQLAKNEGVTLKWPTAEDPTISGHALDYTNRALGDLVNQAKTSGSAQLARALSGTQEQLQAWAEQNIPKVRQAAATYRNLSGPVNSMEAGQSIADQLSGRALNVSGDPQITPQSYKTALARALKAQKYGIQPEAETTLNNVGKDLQRSTVSNSLRSPGSDTAYNIAADGWLAKQLYGKDFGGASMVGRGVGALAAALSGHPYAGAGIMAGGKKLGETVGKSLNEQLAQLLLQPDLLLPYLDAKQAPKALANSLRGNVAQGAVGASLGLRSNP